MVKTQPKLIPDLSTADLERFWSKITVLGPNDCWLWSAGCDRKGYGNFSLKNKTYQAQRVAYKIQIGTDPGVLGVLHHCDNPPWCNGRHLFTGTTQQNTADRHRKGRSASGDNSGRRKHPERWPLAELFISTPVLTPKQVVEIREASKPGVTRQELADKYGVSRPTISMIVNRKIWKHLP